MTFVPSRPCTTAGCTNTVPGRRKSRKCSECQAQRRPTQAPATERGYVKGWDQDFLDHYPLCAHRVPDRCEGYSALADHYPHSRRELLAQGVPEENVDDWERLVPSCDPCHRYLTSQYQPGGFHRKGWVQ